jgi:hypothetical protein
MIIRPYYPHASFILDQPDKTIFGALWPKNVSDLPEAKLTPDISGLIQPGDNGVQQSPQIPARGFGPSYDFFHRGLLHAVRKIFVGQAGKTKDVHPHMLGAYSFQNRGHAYGITA